MRKSQMPVRDDVVEATYHRPPTASEISFGHGATHYATFGIDECVHPGSRFLKAWLKSQYDGLRYYQ